ncbi:hypothetical protein BU23DRAFT_565003 [Bimuria novae-zelandiae CBS 107.79]|uniref:Uncharacterized protein n=1 Tax=Bimuria novae-zelandiae CBS 107.79 TaxID=1447943 RepID=A0A6A5VKQ2_9PLEO|nr:hypothetical protein BU23DRAFT_565003 [Bimuria novae-zelandiae CBS 107.79]
MLAQFSEGIPNRKFASPPQPPSRGTIGLSWTGVARNGKDASRHHGRVRDTGELTVPSSKGLPVAVDAQAGVDKMAYDPLVWVVGMNGHPPSLPSQLPDCSGRVVALRSDDGKTGGNSSCSNDPRSVVRTLPVSDFLHQAPTDTAPADTTNGRRSLQASF